MSNVTIDSKIYVNHFNDQFKTLLQHCLDCITLPITTESQKVYSNLVDKLNTVISMHDKIVMKKYIAEVVDNNDICNHIDQIDVNIFDRIDKIHTDEDIREFLGISKYYNDESKIYLLSSLKQLNKICFLYINAKNIKKNKKSA